MEGSGPSFESFVDSVTRIQHLKYVAVGVFAYAVADYFQTLEAEVKYMWRGRWTLLKTIFFVTRYMFFIDIPLTIAYNESWSFSPQACHGIFGTTSFMCITATGLAEAIMFLRVHALSKQSRTAGIYLSIHFALAQAVAYSLFAIFVQSLVFSPAPPGVDKWPCFPVQGRLEQLSGIFAIILFNSAVITGMSFYFVLTNFKNTEGPLIRSLYKDGIFYFVLVSGMSIANFTLSLSSPPENKFLISLIQRIIHSTLSTRVILNLRDSAERDFDLTLPSLSNVRFKWVAPIFLSTQSQNQSSSYPSSGSDVLVNVSVTRSNSTSR